MLLLAAVGGLWGALHSRAGEALIRTRALDALAGALAGRLQVDGLELEGERILLRGIELYDPEGQLVARIDELEATLWLPGLLRREVVLSDVQVRRPLLHLVDDERGLNLLRALGARHPGPGGASANPSTLVLDLRKVTVSDGRLELDQHGQAQDRHASVSGVHATGAFRLDNRRRAIRGSVKLGAQLELLPFDPAGGPPLQGPLSLEGRFDRSDERLQLDATLDGPGAHLDGEATFALAGETVNLRRLSLSPQTGRALWEDWPVLQPVELSGLLGHGTTELRADLQARAGGAELILQGSVDLARRTAHQLTLRGKGVNPRQLFGQGPDGGFSLNASAEGGGRTLDALDGTLRLDAPAVKVEGQWVGPLKLSATAQQGHFQISELEASLPGATLSGRGEGDPSTFTFAGALTARSLAQLSGAVGALTDRRVPALAGSGQLQLRASGPTRHPSLRVDGAFGSLRSGGVEVRALSLHGLLADVTRPLEAQAELKAQTLRFGTRAFRNLQAEVATRGRHLHVDASAKGLADVVLHAQGLLDPDSQGVAIEELAVRYPEAEWTLQAPSHLGIARGLLQLDPVTIASGAQRLSIALTQRGQALRVGLDARQLDLSLLPKALVDPALQARGLLDATGLLTGTAADPSVTLRLHLTGGGLQRWHDVALELTGTYAHDRAEGELHASGPELGVTGQFELPIIGLARRRNVPLRIQLQVAPFDAAKVAPLLGLEQQVGGTVSGELLVVGTTREPLVRAVVRGRQVAYQPSAPALLINPNFDLTLESGAEGRLALHLDGDASGSSGELSLHTPYTAAGLLAARPTREELLSAPLELDLALHDVDAQLPIGLAEAFLHPSALLPELSGRLSMRAELRGSLRQPTVNARLDGTQLKTERFAATDLTATLVGTGREVSLALGARRGTVPVAALVVHLDAPLARLEQAEALEQLPLELEGTVGPLPLAELQSLRLRDDGQDRMSPAPTALLAAHLHGEGTLADPHLSAEGRMEELRVEQGCIGRADFSWTYARAQSSLHAAFLTGKEGRLDLQATAGLDLSLPALRRGLSLETAPLSGTLSANRFNLAALSGLLPRVRSIGGAFTARAAFSGTLAAPRYDGTAELVDGLLALEGYGEYRQIHLALTASNDRVELKDLSTQGGSGTAHLTALAVRSATGAFTVHGDGNADRFPVIANDQTYAFVTTRLSFDGEASRPLINLRALHIPEAHIELPEAERKDLQEIDRPDDVVVLRNGQPITRRRQKEADTGRPKSAAPGTAEADELPPPRDEADVPAEAAKLTRQIWVTIDAPRNLWVKGSDLNAEVGLSEGFRMEYVDQVSLYGEARVLRGRLTALGRKFELQKDSTARFSGPPTRPYINASAVYKNEREAVTVTVGVRGEGTDITVKPTSEPPLSESEIYTLLATGRRTLKRDSGAALSGAQAASIAGSLLASQLRKTISSKIPLDVLSIESGEEGFVGSKLEAGTYVTDQVYVGYSGRIGANTAKENANAVRLEYQISPHISLEGECGDARVCGADVFWTRDY